MTTRHIKARGITGIVAGGGSHAAPGSKASVALSAAAGWVSSGAGQDGFDSLPEGRRINGWITVELGLDGLEVGAEALAIDETPVEHLANIQKVLRVTTFDLGERLCREIVVVKRELTFLSHKRTPVGPARADRDEVLGRRQFDIQVQRLFQPGNRSQEAVLVRDELEVDVERRTPPSHEHRGSPTRQEDTSRRDRVPGKRPHELAYAGRVR